MLCYVHIAVDLSKSLKSRSQTFNKYDHLTPLWSSFSTNRTISEKHEFFEDELHQRLVSLKYDGALFCTSNCCCKLKKPVAVISEMRNVFVMITRQIHFFAQRILIFLVLFFYIEEVVSAFTF